MWKTIPSIKMKIHGYKSKAELYASFRTYDLLFESFGLINILFPKSNNFN